MSRPTTNTISVRMNTKPMYVRYIWTRSLAGLPRMPS